MMKWIKKTLLFFSCFAWTQQLLSLSTLSLWHNINKRNNQEFLDKTPKKQKRYKSDKSSPSLTKHGESAHSKKPYKCNKDDCTKEYVSLTHFKDHLLLHENPLAFQCHFANCAIIFPSKHYLKKHRETHLLQHSLVQESVQESVCDICFNSYLSLKLLKHHQKEKHNLDHDFMCQICKFTYFDHKLYMKHCKIHTNLFSCLFCISDRSYSSNSNLNHHTTKYHSYYKCKYKDCDEAFILGSLLHQHIEKQHGLPSLPCPECPQSFHGLLTLYQHKYIKHNKFDKNSFIEFLKDFITKNLRCSYPSDVQHPFFNSLFLEEQVLRDSILSDLEIALDGFARPIDESSRPIETLLLYKQFIEKITSKKIPKLEELSLDMLLSYECYRLYLSDDSTIGLLFLKDILSIMIEIRNRLSNPLSNPLKTNYKEMLNSLYTNQFSDQEYSLFMQTFENLFFMEGISISDQIKILKINLLFKKTSA